MRKWLMKHFPIDYKVQIRLVPPEKMQDCLGLWYLNDDEESGVIRLANNFSNDTLVDTLLEEWAHARTEGLEDVDGREDPYHHATFWSELGRITAAYRENPVRTERPTKK